MARILIIDDSKLEIEIMRDTLLQFAKDHYKSDWDLQIAGVNDPVQALSLIQERNFELIITDILMARLDGFQLIREIRKKFPQFDVPIVVVSAIQGVELEYGAMKHGASAWFHKPLHSKEFAEGVFKLITAR